MNVKQKGIFNHLKFRSINFLLFNLITIAVYCCTPNSPSAVVLSDKAEDADLKSYNTYAWLPPDEDFGAIAIEAVENQLKKRGYQLAVDNPDFLVAVHIINEPTDEDVKVPLYSKYVYQGPGYYTGPYQNYYFNDVITVPIYSGRNTEELNFVEGTVVVDVIDREKMEVVWRGWSEDQRHHPLDVMNDLPNYIAQIFEKYPVEPKE